MTIPAFARWIALAVALACILLVLLFVFSPAYAAEETIIAPSSIWFDIWTILQPIIVLLVSTIGPVLVTWIAARVISLLKVSDENQKLAIEGHLRDALHQSAWNALKYAVAKAGVSTMLPGSINPAMISAAAAYVEAKNPDALKKLDVSTEALRDILLSKVPDLELAKDGGSVTTVGD